MKLISSTILVSCALLLSRVVGFIRDMILAAKLGTSLINDAFLTALRLINMFRNIFAEGALSIVFIPVFSKTLNQDGRKSGLIVASQIHLLLILCLLLLIIISFIIMPQIIQYTVPGLKDNIKILKITIVFARTILPYLFCISLASFYGAMLNSLNKFLPFALVPIIFNLAITIAVLFFNCFKTTGHTLAIFTTVGGILELFWMLFFIFKYKYQLYWHEVRLTSQIKSLIKRMLPVIFLALLTHLNTWASIVIISFFNGGISYIYYAERVMQFPLSLIGTAIGTVLLPVLAKTSIQSSNKEMISIQNRALELALLLAVPAAIALFILGENIIFVLFERVNFLSSNTQMVAQVLRILSLGLPAFIMVKLFQAKFYAKLDIYIPMVTSMFCLLINTVISVLTVQLWHFKSLALANSISGWINCIILFVFSIYKFDFYIYRGTVKQVFKYFIASIIMLLCIYLWQELIICRNKYIDTISQILFGFFIYLICCLLLGVNNIVKNKYINS